MGAKVTGLDELGDDLRAAQDEIVKATRGVVSKGALNIKNDARRIAAGIEGEFGGRTIPHYPKSITYDTKVSGTIVSAEIGPDKDKLQGPLGNLLEYGSIHNVAYPHLNPSLDAEEERFVKALEDVGGDLIEGKGVRSEGPPESG